MMKSHTFIAFGLPFPGTHLLLCDTVPLIVLSEAQRNDTRHVGGYQENWSGFTCQTSCEMV